MSGATEELVIVGAGPAGLATAGVAREFGIEPLVIDKAPVFGGAWVKMRPRMRCLSLRHHDRMPDGSFPRGEGERATAAEVADWLQLYARREGFRARLGVSCDALRQDREGLLVVTSGGPVRTRRLVVATGEFGCQRTPDLDGAFEGPSCHSSELDIDDVDPGEHVLVIGAGNSACEIVGLLLARGVRITVAARSGLSDPLGVDTGLLGEVKWWLSALPARYLPDQVRCNPATPVIDTTLVDARDAGRIEVVGEVHSLSAIGVQCRDGAVVTCDRIVLATGFARDTVWLGDIIDRDQYGTPRHDEGLSPEVPGMAYVGIPCQRTRRSGFIRGFAGDARNVLERLG